MDPGRAGTPRAARPGQAAGPRPDPAAGPHATASPGTGGPGRARRWVMVVLVVVVSGHGLLAWLVRPPGVMTGQDDVEYLVLAQSIARGEYTVPFRVDEPPHAKYPPGYPALLAAWMRVAGDGFDAAIALNVILSMLVVATTFFGVRRLFGETTALAAAAALAVNPYMVRLGGALASEPLFTLLTLLALTGLAGRAPVRGRTLALAGAAAIAATMTRTAGLPILAALGLYMLLERRFKALAAFTVATAAVVGAWLLWTVRVAERFIGASYVGDLDALASREGFFSLLVARRMWNQIVAVPSIDLPVTMALPTISGTAIDNIVFGLFLAAGLIAGLTVLARKWRVAALYIALYAVMLVVWPWRGMRFIAPLLPVLIPAAIVGWFAIANRWRARWAPVMALAMAALLFLGGSSATAGFVARGIGCHGPEELPTDECVYLLDQIGFFQALRHIRETVPPGRTFLTAKSGALYHYTGERSVLYSSAVAQTPESFLSHIRADGVNYILLASLEWSEPRKLAHLVRANCDQFVLEGYFDRRTVLFRLADDVSDEQAAATCRAIDRYVAENIDRDFERDP